MPSELIHLQTNYFMSNTLQNSVFKTEVIQVTQNKPGKTLKDNQEDEETYLAPK
jgi:hypothetical protein